MYRGVITVDEHLIPHPSKMWGMRPRAGQNPRALSKARGKYESAYREQARNGFHKQNSFAKALLGLVKSGNANRLPTKVLEQMNVTIRLLDCSLARRKMLLSMLPNFFNNEIGYATSHPVAALEREASQMNRQEADAIRKGLALQRVTLQRLLEQDQLRQERIEARRAAKRGTAIPLIDQDVELNEDEELSLEENAYWEKFFADIEISEGRADECEAHGQDWLEQFEEREAIKGLLLDHAPLDQ